MIFTGKLKLEDGTIIGFFENGEVLRTVRGQNSRITMNEAIMYVNNANSFTFASKAHALDGKLVSYAAFVEEFMKMEVPGPYIADNDYREQYTVHDPDRYVNETKEIIDAPTITQIDSNVDVEDKDKDADAVVVNPEDTGTWWE